MTNLREVVVGYLRARNLDVLPCPDGAALNPATAEAPAELLAMRGAATEVVTKR